MENSVWPMAEWQSIITPLPKGPHYAAYRTWGYEKKGWIFLGRFLSSFMRLETRSSGWDWLEGGRVKGAWVGIG